MARIGRLVGRFLERPRCGTFSYPDPCMRAAMRTAVQNPFDLDRPQDYLAWREFKLARYPRKAEDLIVEVRDPRNLSDCEVDEIRRVCAVANMAIYSGPLSGSADKEIALRLGMRLGLAPANANPLADDDGISRLEVTPEKSGRGYIPYSDQRLLWHTDGYYNAPEQRIRAFILHCVRPAASGGENGLLDHEMAYIMLRDADPRYVKALSAPDALTIPANTSIGTPPRPARTGPVISCDDGSMHMRYTARARSVEWRPDDITRAAVQCLNGILSEDAPHVFTVRLAGGQGLVCNNVLHNRSAFVDDMASGARRLVYRARYPNRIAEREAVL